jgi:hypothetical protein
MKRTIRRQEELSGLHGAPSIVKGCENRVGTMGWACSYDRGKKGVYNYGT